jgi:hypothetical protein
MCRKLSDGGMVSVALALLASAFPVFGSGRLSRPRSTGGSLATARSLGTPSVWGLWSPGCSATIRSR